MKKGLLVLLVLVLTISVCGCKKSETLIAAEDAIKAIGTVTVDSGDAIKKAEDAIAKLTEEDKEKFKMNDDFEAIKTEYQNVVTEAEAAKVVDAISKMGEASMDNLESVNDAQKKYDALSDDAKALVSNYNILKSAQEKLSAEKKAKADELLSTMKLDEDRVRNLKFYYPQGWRHYSDGWAADIKSFVLPYIGIQGDDVWLRMVCNYTDDDWVFFKKITFSVDGKNYYKFFSYNDVVRDNEAGDVWEYVDIEVEDNEINILSAIANSTETIVRFEGDNYYRDVTISDTDKKGIADALLVYQLLK